jgi:hypothetical protein
LFIIYYFFFYFFIFFYFFVVSVSLTFLVQLLILPCISRKTLTRPYFPCKSPDPSHFYHLYKDYYAAINCCELSLQHAHADALFLKASESAANIVCLSGSKIRPSHVITLQPPFPSNRDNNLELIP